MTDPEPTSTVSISIKHEEPDRYIVQSSQLAQIGSLWRGSSRTDYFRSLILPFLVAFFTAFLPYAIQYVTWNESTKLQRAADRTEKALSTYESAATAIGQRLNATNDLFQTINHLADPQTNKGDERGPLYTAAVNLEEGRWAAYYDKLSNWKNTYDGILENIDYTLDQPVIDQIDKSSPKIGNAILGSKTKNVICNPKDPKAAKKPLDLGSQALHVGYIKYSLKAQFAIIAFCLDQIDGNFGTPETLAKAPIGQPSTDKVTAIIGTVAAMANSYHCYAARRLEYFYEEKQMATPTVHNLLAGDLSYDTKLDDKCP